MTGRISSFGRSPVPMGSAIAATRAQFARFLGECLKPETRWRKEVNSNCRYRFSKLSDDSIKVEFAAAGRIAPYFAETTILSALLRISPVIAGRD
jgi:hypothetical protein